MTDTMNLGLPFIEAAQAQKHVTHNEALRILDALVMLSVLDRDVTSPPALPAEGARYLVKAPGSGAFANKDNQIAHFVDGGWAFHAPRTGWTCYVQDEGALIAWNGASWVAAIDAISGGSEFQNVSLLGVGTAADAVNPLSAKINNALWAAKALAEGGDGDLRYKMSKESVANTLSILLQTNFSGRAEIGLSGDDDFHFKTSADGINWIDAILLDRATGSAKINSGFFLTADITPPQIIADQNDYDPAGLSTASILRLSSDAARNVTGLSGGGDGRILTLVNVGASGIVLKNANASSGAANQFAFGADVTLAARQSALLWYDAVDSRWKLLAGPQAATGGGSGPADLDLVLAELALGLADAQNAAQFLGNAGNRFADSFDALTSVDVAGAVNLDTATAGLLKPSTASSSATTFSFTGANQAYVVPAGVTKVTFKAWGAGGAGGGGGGIGGAGGFVLAQDIAVTPGETLNVKVGGGGQTSVSQASWQGAGGGMTSLDRGGALLAVAGAGGGAGFGLSGGNGGGATGGVGGGSNPGQGGSQTAGGAGGTSATAGSSGQGGRAASGIATDSVGGFNGGAAGDGDNATWTSGGGGGGYFGGGGAGTGSGAGGGGSSFFGASGSTSQGAGTTAPQTADPDYPGGTIGKGGAAQSNGGNGFAKITPNIGGSNMTVASAALTATVQPTSVKAVLRVKFIDPVVLGTDYLVEASRDGGATWSAFTLNDRFTANSIRVIESDVLDISVQPPGTSVKWRIRTLNSKMAETNDIYLYWT